MRRTYIERRKATYKKCKQRSRMYDNIYAGINNYDTIHRYAKESIPPREKSPSRKNTRDERLFSSLGDSIEEYFEEGEEE